MVTSTPTATAHGVAHSGVFHVMTHARFLAARTIRESLRQPGVEVTNIFIPLFFLAVSTAAIGQVAGRAFGVDNYLGFQLPVAVLQAVAGSSSASGIAMVTDMERGYFDKLLLTPGLALVADHRSRQLPTRSAPSSSARSCWPRR